MPPVTTRPGSRATLSMKTRASFSTGRSRSARSFTCTHDLIRVVDQAIHVLVKLRIVDQLPERALAVVERLREHGEFLDQAIQAVDGIDDRSGDFLAAAGRAAR